jgi:hypothetical protein
MVVSILTLEGTWKMKKILMIGAAIAALMGPARAADECGYLHAQWLERTAAAEQAMQTSLDFTNTYGAQLIARRSQLWAAAQRLEQQAQSTVAAATATGQAMLADNCVAPADLPRFRKLLAALRWNPLPGGLTG